MIRNHTEPRPLGLPLCWVALGCLLATGCGGAGDLSGKVTYKDKPLRMGSVNVVGSDGIIRAGTIEDDGAYSVTGIPPGTVKIAVSSPNPAKQKVAVKPKPGEVVKPSTDASKWFAIPETYGDFEQSGLTFAVERGANQFPIDLK